MANLRRCLYLYRTAPNKMIDDWWIIKEYLGSCRGLLCIISKHIFVGSEEKQVHPIRAGVSTDVEPKDYRLRFQSATATLTPSVKHLLFLPSSIPLTRDAKQLPFSLSFSLSSHVFAWDQNSFIPMDLFNVILFPYTLTLLLLQNLPLYLQTRGIAGGKVLWRINSK